MSNKTKQNRFFRLGALIGLMTLGGVAGCGEGMTEPTASAMYALTGNVAGPYGTTSGTVQGPGNNQLTPVTKIVGYHTSAYVYGIRLYWGSTSVLYGQTNGVTGDVFDLTDDPVVSVRYLVNLGVMRGIKFTTGDGRTLELGLIPATAVAFSSADALFTDLQTWKGTINGTPVLWGAKFYYTTP